MPYLFPALDTEPDCDLRLDDTQMPPRPPLTEGDASWLAALLQGAGLR